MLQQPVNRVSHVVYCVRPENFERATAFLSEVLGARFEDSSRPELGLRIRISLESGLELISPDATLGPGYRIGHSYFCRSDANPTTQFASGSAVRAHPRGDIERPILTD